MRANKNITLFVVIIFTTILITPFNWVIDLSVKAQDINTSDDEPYPPPDNGDMAYPIYEQTLSPPTLSPTASPSNRLIIRGNGTVDEINVDPSLYGSVVTADDGSIIALPYTGNLIEEHLTGQSELDRIIGDDNRIQIHNTKISHIVPSYIFGDS